MEQIHSLPDGTKLAVWEERNQAMALSLPFRRGMGTMVLARDVLKDLTTAVFRGLVYYAYHSLEHRIFFGAVGEGAPTAVLSDPPDARHYSALKLLEWKGELYLFYRSREQGGKNWEIKVMRPLSDREESALWKGILEPVEPVYAVTGEKLIILAEGKIYTWDGEHPPEPGEIMRLGTGRKARDTILRLEAENRRERERVKTLAQEHHAQVTEIKKQYDELASYAVELQQEGKRWREKYYKKH